MHAELNEDIRRCFRKEVAMDNEAIANKADRRHVKMAMEDINSN